jgi:hypothetical protein
MRRLWQRRDEEDPVKAGEAAAAAAERRLVLPSPDLSAAAFFDVDNTMMRGASIYTRPWPGLPQAVHHA